MGAQKVAITIPEEVLAMVDAASRRHKMSRSRLISRVLAEKMAEEQAIALKDAYDEVFSDPQVRKEQSETAAALESVGDDRGQEW